MKKLYFVRTYIAVALSIFHAATFSTTLTPIQLLSPTGSASGQAIVSTGASTAPSWANISATSLAPMGANTIIANATGSSASPTAFSMPSCSSSSSALLYASGTGFACGSNFAMTAGAIFTGAVTPSQTNGIVGTTTNNNANAGSIGEFVTASSSTTSISTATPTNIISISLTAGDWDVSGTACVTPTATVSQWVLGISTTSASIPAAPNITSINAVSNTGAAYCLPVMPIRESLSATTTVYLVGQTTFSSGTATTIGVIRARRIR